jgi:hypothetical protein
MNRFVAVAAIVHSPLIGSVMPEEGWYQVRELAMQIYGLFWMLTPGIKTSTAQLGKRGKASAAKIRALDRVLSNARKTIKCIVSSEGILVADNDCQREGNLSHVHDRIHVVDFDPGLGGDDCERTSLRHMNVAVGINAYHNFGKFSGIPESPDNRHESIPIPIPDARLIRGRIYASEGRKVEVVGAEIVWAEIRFDILSAHLYYPVRRNRRTAFRLILTTAGQPNLCRFIKEAK